VYLIRRKGELSHGQSILDVSLTHAKDNADKATVAFVVANAAVGSGKGGRSSSSVVEAVASLQKRATPTTSARGFAPLRELMDNFAKAGGTMYVCSPGFNEAQARREPTYP